MAALMDEELAVAAATKDAAGDDEHLAILVSLLAMIAEEDKTCTDVFQKLVEGNAPPMQLEINDHQYEKGYYLADGIYPRWSTFVKTISNPIPGGEKAWFAQMHEAARKDVERAFGVLQARFTIV
ncbi:hypothetical protein QYE76_029577 [Lolium multiflorum]|uniref:Uncharacterized protein n=1 Tax=Lolium multiflorum TaxID=4521 RepID=A0AAD8QPU4_LOLMU|nr:hypothetical protein QYE76_029577 [Lolium multiflorum]